ncbi:MAG TPA: hypothetical protein VHV10_06980, partial [Ktedonobacteraceae bacterium]|nr:hypothetical protein [Ktedonobacteraceae bacterium]
MTSPMCGDNLKHPLAHALLCPQLQRLGFRGCGSSSHACELDAGGAFGGVGRSAARPVTQEFSQTGSVDAYTEEARVAANTGLAHWEAAKWALHHPLLARATRVSHMPRRAVHWTANSDAAGSIAEDRRAILGRAFPFNSGTTPPHPQNGRPPLGAAMSQPPPGTPVGKQSSGSSATPPAHPTRVSHTRRSAAQRRAIQMRRQHGRGPARHIGARVPHHREWAHCTDARRQGGVVASQPRLSPLLAIPPPHFLS